MHPTPEKTVEQFELYELAMKLACTLPPSQRTALRAHQQNDFSIRKAAQRIGVPEGTLKAQLARGRAKLAERFHNMLANPKRRISKSTSKPRRGATSPVHKSNRERVSQPIVAGIGEKEGSEAPVST